MADRASSTSLVGGAKSTPADNRLLDQRRRAGIAHAAVAGSAGRCSAVRAPAIDQAFSCQLGGIAQIASKDEHPVRLTGSDLSDDARTMLGAIAERSAHTGGRPVDLTTGSAAEFLGISYSKALAAKDELLSRGFIQPQSNNFGGHDGYQLTYRGKEWC